MSHQGPVFLPCIVCQQEAPQKNHATTNVLCFLLQVVTALHQECSLAVAIMPYSRGSALLLHQYGVKLILKVVCVFEQLTARDLLDRIMLV